MFKGRLLVLLLVLCMALSAFCAGRIPGQAGTWRVEVGPPGNKFCEVPTEKTQEAGEKAPPPSEAVLQWATIFAPQAKVTERKLKSDGYRLYAQASDAEYKFYVTPKGELFELKYENNAADVQEQADELVLRGTKKSIAVSEVPKAALKTLAEAMPDVKPSKAWTADTIAGRWYVILIGEIAFYARPDGQIQAGGLVNDGALDEIYPPSTQKNSNPKSFNAKLEKLLGQYRQRFNFENQIKRLGKGPSSGDGSFRYVVMGDSRSHWELWSNIVKHIDSLKPKPDFVINVGDVVSHGYAREYHDYYVRALLETDIPFFIAIGNHDDGSDSMAREYRYLFGKRALNYYFDYGNARYIFIDNATKVQPYDKTLKWLDKTLADTPKGYRKYVAAHKPPSTIEKWAYHAWDDADSKTFTDLMTKHKVDEVYHGHIHAYSTATFGGISYTLTGGGGARLHDRYGPLGNVHHYIICDVMGDGTVKQQVVRYYDSNKKR